MVVFSQGFCIYSSFGNVTVLSIALASKLLFECDLLMKRSNMLGHWDDKYIGDVYKILCVVVNEVE